MFNKTDKQSNKQEMNIRKRKVARLDRPLWVGRHTILVLAYKERTGADGSLERTNKTNTSN